MPAKIRENYTIDKKTGCWNFNHGDNDFRPKVYRNGQHWTASRWYYHKHKGEIPEGHEIDHLCHNGRCVNPEHLEAVTHTENIRRRRTNNMTYSKVSKIRELYATGNYKQRELAEMFDSDQPNISKIVNEKRWSCHT